MSGTAQQAMMEGKATASAIRSWGFRLPVWRSKADKLAAALGDYVVERGRIGITPILRWNSWGVVIEVSHIMRAERVLADPPGERQQRHLNARAQIGPCVFLIDVSSSYTHRNFANSATQVDEHATQAMPSRVNALTNASTLRIKGKLPSAHLHGKSAGQPPPIPTMPTMPKFPTGRIPR